MTNFKIEILIIIICKRSTLFPRETNRILNKFKERISIITNSFYRINNSNTRTVNKMEMILKKKLST